MKIFTIGHSHLDFSLFVSVLKSFHIEKLIDVRSMPGSRHVPQFNQETLSFELEKEKIEYVHFPKLGGRRKGSCKDDDERVNGWKNHSFQNYASYTMTPEYEEGIEELLAEAKKKSVCIMCAESVPWRCHRLLISNTLVSKGVEVFHIMSKRQYLLHELNRYGAHAEIHDGKVIYPLQKPHSFFKTAPEGHVPPFMGLEDKCQS